MIYSKNIDSIENFTLLKGVKTDQIDIDLLREELDFTQSSFCKEIITPITDDCLTSITPTVNPATTPGAEMITLIIIVFIMQILVC